VVSASGHVKEYTLNSHRSSRESSSSDYSSNSGNFFELWTNTSRSVDRYRKRGTEFYSIIDGTFASMIILLSAVNEFVGAFEDDEVRKILRIPIQVKPIGIIADINYVTHL